jgi:hypothetical protein
MEHPENARTLNKAIEMWEKRYKKMSDRITVLEIITMEIYNSQQELVEWRERQEDKEDEQ